jgi:hypothetical protein
VACPTKNVLSFGFEHTVNHSSCQQLNHMAEISRGLYTLGFALAASEKECCKKLGNNSHSGNTTPAMSSIAGAARGHGPDQQFGQWLMSKGDQRHTQPNPNCCFGSNISRGFLLNYLNEKEVAAHHIQKNCIDAVTDSQDMWIYYNTLTDMDSRKRDDICTIVKEAICIINNSEYILHQLCKFAYTEDDACP